MKNIRRKIAASLAIVLVLLVTSCGSESKNIQSQSQQIEVTEHIEVSSVPEYSGEPYITVENNEPDFTDAEFEEDVFESYSELDAQGRCGVAEAVVGKELMPKEERGKIGQVKPSGWHTVKYDNVEGKYLYNRCHLIGYQLTAENANEKNLITGTRYMNVEGMLPFENMVADYIDETNQHVRYRVTPIYEGDNLVASGVEMEAESVEDKGDGLSFHVYVYNVQPGIEIDYETGESAEAEAETSVKNPDNQEETYILNTNNKKFHKPHCSSVRDMKKKNKKSYQGSREELLKKGYEPCGRCKP